MPTAAPETPRSISLHEDDEVLEEAYRSLARSEALTEEAITELVAAVTELMSAVVPTVVLQPARAVDVTLQLLEQSLRLQRRFLYELLSSIQRAVLQVGGDRRFDATRDRSGNGSSSSRSNNRRSSTRSA